MRKRVFLRGIIVVMGVLVWGGEVEARDGNRDKDIFLYKVDLKREFCGDRYCGRTVVEIKKTKRQNNKTNKKKRKRINFSLERKTLPNNSIQSRISETFGVIERKSSFVLKSLPFVFGRLVCAVNVNLALKAQGIKGTNSKLARDFLKWGRESPPVPGAVAIYARGKNPRNGHVAIVSRIQNGKVYVMNPGKRGWKEIIYPKRALGYRVALSE